MSYVTPKKNAAFVFYTALEDQANPGLFKASATLAAGDAKVAIDDGAPANLATLPVVDADFTKRIKVSLSADEMNGDNITVLLSDAAGAEWYDQLINIQTSARQVDDLATPTNITAGTITTVTTVSGLAANAITAAAIATGAIDADAVAADAIAEIADGVWDEATSGHTTAGTFGKLVIDISTVVSLLNSKIGAWTATGVNTVLGAFKAALSKSATLPADIGGTFDPAADSTEAISEAVAAVKVDTAAILEDTGTTLPGLFAASGATVTVISAVDGGTITVYVADTWSFTVTDATLDLSGYEAVALSVKRNARQADADALLYLRSDTELQRIGGAAPVSAGNGTLSKTATSFTALVALAETSAAGLIPGQYSWWLKGFDTTPAPDTGFTLATGAFVLERAGLAAVA